MEEGRMEKTEQIIILGLNKKIVKIYVVKKQEPNWRKKSITRLSATNEQRLIQVDRNKRKKRRKENFQRFLKEREVILRGQREKEH